MEVFSAVSFGDARCWLDLLPSRYPPSRELSKSCLGAPGRLCNVKGFLIPSVTHSSLQGFQKSHNPVPSPGSESEAFCLLSFGPCVPAAVLVAAPAPLADPLIQRVGMGIFPCPELHFFGVMVAEGRGHLCPFAWSVLLKPAGGHALLTVPLGGFFTSATTKGVACPSCLSTVMTLLMAKVFPKSHKLFLGIREDSVPLVRGFFQCLGLVPSFFGICLLHICCSSCQNFCVAAMWALSGGRRGEREVESCAWYLWTSSQPLCWGNSTN